MQPLAKWELVERAAGVRKRLVHAGYLPVPAVGKAVFLKGWTDFRSPAEITDEVIDQWAKDHRDAVNTGCLARNTPGIDIDISDPAAADAVESLLRAQFEESGRIIVRFGNAPRRLIPLRTDVPFKKSEIVFKTPNGVEAKLEILSDGQQFIADGVHPDTRRKYDYHAGVALWMVPREDLPYCNEQQVQEFLAAATHLLVTEFGYELVSAAPTGNGADTADTLFNEIYGPDTVDYAELIKRIRAGVALHDSLLALSMSLVGSGASESAAVRLLEAEMQQSSAPRDARWQERVDEIPRLVAGAVRKRGAAHGGKSEQATCATLQTVRACDVTQRPVSWLWKNRLARGKLTLIAGDPGIGKSQILIDAVARTTTAAPWPDGGMAPPGSCLILSAEDAAADTLCPRLELAGADLSRVEIIQAVVEKSGNTRSFNLQRDLTALRAVAARLGDVVLIGIDPITAYLGGDVDSHRTTDVRAVLAMLDKFAEETDIAGLGITHPPKAAQSKAINAFTGSLAFVAAARLAFVAVVELETERTLLLPVKNNLGPKAEGIGYRIETGTTPKGIETCRIVWDLTPVIMTANEAMAEAASEPKRGAQRREAEEFLAAYLEAGPMPASAVQTAADANGFSVSTLRRAREQLRVTVEKVGYGTGAAWQWRLP